MIYYCDGFCFEKNPSPLGGGYTIVNKNKKLIAHEKIYKQNFTNNEAELLGIYNSLRVAKKNDTVVSDSQICIGWVYRKLAGSRIDLNNIAKDANSMMVARQVHLAWQPRDVNLAGKYNEQFERYLEKYANKTTNK